MRHFKGRVAVITGAAGGLGHAVAGAAAARGMRLVLADVDAEALERTTDALVAQGVEVLAMVCDVRKATHVEELADAAIARFHGVHLVFNNAGVANAGPVWEHAQADWEWVLGVNLWGAIHGVRVFAPLMLDCARRDPGYDGHIVNTAGMAVLLSAPGQGTLSVAEHGVVALTETLYHDLRHAGAPIGVSVLCPDRVRTGIAWSERQRPPELRNPAPPTAGQQAATAALAHAIAGAAMTADDVARAAFVAIERGEFYIVRQPDALQAAAARMHAIAHGLPPPGGAG